MPRRMIMSEYSKFQQTASASAVAAFMAFAVPAQAQAQAQGEAATGVAVADSGQAVAPAAAAGATAAADKGPDKGQLQEVVVTAQKRVSTAQKTAASISVFDAKTLEKNGVQTLQDLTKLAP